MKYLLALLFLAAHTNDVFAESKTLTWTVDGTQRQALLFTPATAQTSPQPLVFVFHGAGDTAQNFAGVGFQHAWPDAAIVYMQGLARTPGGGGAFQTTDASSANRDLKLFDVALADLRTRLRVDESRIYATGFSNGAKFIYLLWATRARTFAAFAPVAGMLTAPASFTVPKPLLHIGGREDRQNDFRLQLESVEAARAANGATGKGSACGADCAFYASNAGAPVMTILHAGGHIYPGDATRRIVEFFRVHPARPNP